MKTTQQKTNWTLGELSPRVKGRFDENKPVFSNGAEIIENMLMFQSGGIMLRPGTRFVVEVKDSTKKVRLERFRYSTVQEYIMEMGNLYIRFCANGGQLVIGFTPVEVTTTYLEADLFDLQMANKADVMYIVHPSYFPKKLIRTSATTFTFTDVPFVRGPFLDDNITTTTITPSADTGNGIQLTASTGIFQSGHVGALWRVKGGVVKITAFSSVTVVTGNVQVEPDGTAGNLGTGPAATTDWAEGAFSAVRGFPTAVTFHEQRLLYGGTTFAPQKFYGSVVGAYDNFNKGTGTASDAYIFEVGSNLVNDIRWMTSDVDLKIGTSGGTITAKGSVNEGITPTSPPNIIIDTDYSVMQRQPEKIGGAIMYLQANTFQLRQLIFNLAENRDQSEDMTLLADHILRDGRGAVQTARQQSPNDRIWVIRSDGQLSVFTRNAAQQVQAWSRFLTGKKPCSNTDGNFESISVLPQDAADDQVWVVVKRNFQGTIKRYIEYFTPELFDNDWEPVRVDCSLTLNNPITITAISQGNPVLVTAPAHGFSNGDQVKIDNVVGMTQLNGKSFLIDNVTVDTFEIFEIT